MDDSDKDDSDREDALNDPEDEDYEINEDEESDAPTEKKNRKRRRRKRTKEYTVTNFLNFTFQDLQQHFDHPISRAAKSLSVSETYLKKLCRHFKIFRWPYRKLTSLQKKIDHYKQGVSEEQLTDDVKKQITEIQEEMKAIRENPALVLKRGSKSSESLTNSPDSPTPSPPTPSESKSRPEPQQQRKSISSERYAPYPVPSKPNAATDQQLIQEIQRILAGQQNTRIDNNVVQSQQQIRMQHLPEQIVVQDQVYRTSTETQRPQPRLSINTRDIRSSDSIGYSPLGLRLDAEEVASILSRDTTYRPIRL